MESALQKFAPLSRTVSFNTPSGKIEWGGRNTFVLMAGPDSFESFEMVRDTAKELKSLTTSLQIPWILKCSFDKANRQSAGSFRGLGMDEALRGLEKIKGELGVTVITDVHETTQVERVAAVADIIQIPAFLCRQTDLVVAAARTGRVLNIKKGQFMAPWDMGAIVEKARAAGNDKVLLCERGASFGYNRLITDMMSLVEMRKFGVPVVYDATHSVQVPGGRGTSSGGLKSMIAPLARAALATGIDGIFMETHPDPENALCDGPISVPLHEMGEMLKSLKAIDSVVKGL
ncbi:MAG TPA: 3-deoxy-8-phosphooctulonate synthase [Bdellovibrionota bacterium]|jgi:2-dehydro-3-deoxyphosphooctonate aldolase (KDO 8-P synthase)|nr:3-deoxy-8-phosphooctulonate synthase [Bdellovibrionota bacterium]